MISHCGLVGGRGEHAVLLSRNRFVLVEAFLWARRDRILAWVSCA